MIINKKSIRSLALSLSIAGGAGLTMTSCKSLDANVSSIDVATVDSGQKGPTKNITRYDRSLQRFGRMLAAYNCDYLRIQSKAISDATAAGGVPKNLQQMVITSLNKIGSRLSYVDYDPSYVLTQDALAERGATPGRADITLQAPNVLVSGAITEYDKGLVSRIKSQNLDISGGGGSSEFELGVGRESEMDVSRIAIDLQLVDYSTQQLISGVQTSNRVMVSKKTNSSEMGFALAGSGFGLNGSLKQKQGLHSAIRLLVEMSVLELLGNYFDVPYWRCVEGAQQDQNLIAKWREKLEDDDNDTFTAKLKLLAYTHGYDMDLFTLTLNENELAMYTELKEKTGIEDDFDLMIHLWENVPIRDGARRLKIAKKMMIDAQAQAEQEPASTEVPSSTNAGDAVPQTTPQESVPTMPKTAPGLIIFGELSDEDFDED